MYSTRMIPLLVWFSLLHASAHEQKFLVGTLTCRCLCLTAFLFFVEVIGQGSESGLAVADRVAGGDCG